MSREKSNWAKDLSETTDAYYKNKNMPLRELKEGEEYFSDKLEKSITLEGNIIHTLSYCQIDYLRNLFWNEGLNPAKSKIEFLALDSEGYLIVGEIRYGTAARKVVKSNPCT